MDSHLTLDNEIISNQWSIFILLASSRGRIGQKVCLTLLVLQKSFLNEE